MVNGHVFTNPIRLTLRRWHFLWVFIFDAGLTIETLWHHMTSYENVWAEIWNISNHVTMFMVRKVVIYDMGDIEVQQGWCAGGRIWMVIFLGQRSTHSPMNRSVFITFINQWWLWSNHIQPKLWCYGDWFGINQSAIFCHFVCHQWGSMILSSLCCRVSRTGHD